MNKKKRIFKRIILFGLGLVLLSSCSKPIKNTSASIDLKRYVNIKEYIVKCAYYDDHQAYIELVVSNSDKRTLLQEFKFENNLSKLKGKVEPAFISENPNYIYFLDENGKGPYGYILYSLENNGNTLIIYEIYGG